MITWEEWTTRRYDCPHCGDDVYYKEKQQVSRCANCGSSFEVNDDYSFEDGSYRDCSTLTYTGYTEGREANE